MAGVHISRDTTVTASHYLDRMCQQVVEDHTPNHIQLPARCGKTAFGMLPVQGTPHLCTIDMTRI
jgi:hypothetical protein